MKIALLCEKISQVIHAMPIIDRIHGKEASIVVATINPYRSLSPNFVFPRGLRLRDYPLAVAPTYRPINLTEDRQCGWHEPIRLDDRWTTVPRSADAEMALRDFRSSDLILSLGDTYPSSAYLAGIALDQLLIAGRNDPRVLAPTILSLDEASLTDAISRAAPFEESMGTMARRGAIKQRLDYNYALNSNVFLRPIQQSAGMAADAAPLSKYAIQILFDLGDLTQGFTECEAYERMQKWRGTGRYPKDSHFHQLGSPASRGTIIKSLRDGGLVELVGSHERKGPKGTYVRQILRVSDLGREVLDNLHPDCRDPDLPFRIEAWGRLPEIEANAKVDRYIRTFFGKMGRYARRYEAATGARALMPA